MPVVVFVMAPLLLGLLSTTPSLAWAAPVSRTITVDCHGRGDVRTVQSAVDSVPDGNRDWIKIHVMAGTRHLLVRFVLHLSLLYCCSVLANTSSFDIITSGIMWKLKRIEGTYSSLNLFAADDEAMS